MPMGGSTPMIKRFVARSPRAASGLMYTAGYLGGSLLGLLVGYLVSGTLKSGATALGAGCGALALYVAQRRGIVPEAGELNKPISLFGPRGFHEDGRGPT
jgi:hypothetical protein